MPAQPQPLLTLYQAEWCPYSSAVRQRLTELGLAFVARQVAPHPEQRDDVEEIPTLETEGGERFVGTRAILAYLRGLDPGADEEEHRRQYDEHEPDRRRRRTRRVLEREAPLAGVPAPA